MEEKKQIKVSLGTVICIFIIIFLIVALGVMYYLGFVRNNETKIENKSEGNNILVSKETEKSNITSENKETSNSNNNQEIIDILNDIEERCSKKSVMHELRVRKITKDNENNKYLITAEYLVPIEITEEEYQDIVKTSNCEKYLGFMGTYKKNSETFGEGMGYGFVTIPSQDFNGSVEYEIVKTDTGYAFIVPVGAGYPMSRTEKKVTFYLNENDMIYLNGEKTLKECSEKLTEDYVVSSIITVMYENNGLYLHVSGK